MGYDNRARYSTCGSQMDMARWIWRVVYSTPTSLLSALLFPAASLSWLRNVWQSETIITLASQTTTLELLRVHSYPKFRLTEQEREDLLADYLPWCETVVVSNPLAVPHCRDAFDRPFLELALAGSDDALVTGDDDLSALAPIFRCPSSLPLPRGGVSRRNERPRLYAPITRTHTSTSRPGPGYDRDFERRSWYMGTRRQSCSRESTM